MRFLYQPSRRLIRQVRLYHINMALNSASHNAGGTPTGSSSGAPAPVSEETVADILKSTSKDATGQSVPGKDLGDPKAGVKVKSEKELAREKAKAEKLKKFEEKKAKSKAAPPPSAAKEAKKEKKKEEPVPEFVNETPKGEKKVLKSLDDPLYKAYNHKVVESAWMDWWKKEKFFEPDFSKKGPAFTIVIPPPNITGNLHVGHALATALQDALIRWKRMQQDGPVLYLPGCDHAGISTQSVIENL
jgi:valyl-tRNA synthetase